MGSGLASGAACAPHLELPSRQQPRQRPDRHGAHQRRGVVQPSLGGSCQARVAAVADGDEDVAQEAVAAGALDGRAGEDAAEARVVRSEEHTSELQSLMRISYAVFCLKKKKKKSTRKIETEA